MNYMGDQPRPRVEIEAQEAGDEVVCRVRDNGIGIEEQHHAKVFELFERLNAETEGTGIGLALISRIVEAHGGRIWVESEGKGRGSTFCFSLPRAPSSLPATPRSPAAGGKRCRGLGRGRGRARTPRAKPRAVGGRIEGVGYLVP